jgi:hypothetical protein
MLTITSSVGQSIATREDSAASRSSAPVEVERMRCDSEGRVLRVSGFVPLACRLDEPATDPKQS